MAEEPDQELLKRLLVEGSTFVLLDMPVGSEFGIDMQSWNTGEKFRGVKMIPPGIHFVYYSAVNEDQVAPRTGFFHNFERQELLAKRWDPKAEGITDVGNDELHRLRQNLYNLDPFLGAYPFSVFSKWVSLTDKLNFEMVQRLQPEDGIIYSVQQFESAVFPPKEGTDLTKIPDLKEVKSSGVRFTEFPSFRHPEGVSGSELNKYGMDSSFVLDCLLQSVGDSQNLLAEIQFAFVSFLVGQLYQGFEQWKKLMHTVCTSEQAISNKQLEPFFCSFITLLHFQIKEIPQDFFVDIVSKENFLTSTLSLFFRNAQDSAPPNGPLRSKAERFRVHLTKHFKWDFDQEPEDEAPVLVDP